MSTTTTSTSTPWMPPTPWTRCHWQDWAPSTEPMCCDHLFSTGGTELDFWTLWPMTKEDRVSYQAITDHHYQLIMFRPRLAPAPKEGDSRPTERTDLVAWTEETNLEERLQDGFWRTTILIVIYLPIHLFFKTIHTLHKYSKAIHPNQAREDAEYYENTFKASIHIESYILWQPMLVHFFSIWF